MISLLPIYTLMWSMYTSITVIVIDCNYYRLKCNCNRDLPSMSVIVIKHRTTSRCIQAHLQCRFLLTRSRWAYQKCSIPHSVWEHPTQCGSTPHLLRVHAGLGMCGVSNFCSGSGPCDNSKQPPSLLEVPRGLAC